MNLAVEALRALHEAGYERADVTIHPDGQVVAAVPCGISQATKPFERFDGVAQSVAEGRGLHCVTTEDRTLPMRSFVAHWFGEVGYDE